ncbi:hypothetical protein [Timonella senegalensis]|uniref:hypothetical protein n=1 Tax=Timonella senegalensis TaxID=1465825 RepID=UPI002FDCAFC0
MTSPFIYDDSPNDPSTPVSAPQVGAETDPANPLEETATLPSAGSEPPARGSWLPKAAIVLLSVLLIGAIYLANRWSAYGDSVEAANRELGEQIAQSRSELASAKSSLDSTRDQLATAQKRISELATEKAQAGDDRESQRILAQDTAALANEALKVSRDFGECVSNQSDLVSSLSDVLSNQSKLLTQANKAPQDRDAAEVSEINSSLSTARSAVNSDQDAVNATCKAAIDRYNDLIASLED